MSAPTLQGGSIAATISGNLYLARPGTRFYRMTPGSSSDVIRLPDARLLTPGGPIFVIANTHATWGIQVDDADSSALGTISTESAVTFNLIDNSTAAGTWKTTQNVAYSEGAALTTQVAEFEIGIAGDVPNVVVETLVRAEGWDQTSPVDVTVTILPDIDVYSVTTSLPAMRIGNLPSASIVRIVNQGYISGQGGAGGDGAGGTAQGSLWTTRNASGGSAGGTAFDCDAPGGVTVYVDNAIGTIRGGGGGGGGGGGTYESTNGYEATGGGGGGGQGHDSGAGGPRVPSRRGFVEAEPGSTASAGDGGVGGVVARGSGPPLDEGTDGGAGGSWGSAGNDGVDGFGSTSSPFKDKGTGGAGGNAVEGDSGITWIATGTRLGTVA